MIYNLKIDNANIKKEKRKNLVAVIKCVIVDKIVIGLCLFSLLKCPFMIF